jgi:hypothetical protein
MLKLLVTVSMNYPNYTEAQGGSITGQNREVLDREAWYTSLALIKTHADAKDAKDDGLLI